MQRRPDRFLIRHMPVIQFVTNFVRADRYCHWLICTQDCDLKYDSLNTPLWSHQLLCMRHLIPRVQLRVREPSRLNLQSCTRTRATNVNPIVLYQTRLSRFLLVVSTFASLYIETIENNFTQGSLSLDVPVYIDRLDQFPLEYLTKKSSCCRRKNSLLSASLNCVF